MTESGNDRHPLAEGEGAAAALAAGLAKDRADVRALAGRWRQGKRIDGELMAAICEALDNGRCPQAVYVALVDAAFIKRNDMRSTHRLATFWGTVTNQENRIGHWVMDRLGLIELAGSSTESPAKDQ